MSTLQPNDARVIAVDPKLGDVLRTQTLAVLEFNHHHFEDLRDLDPEAQLALSVILRDAFAILDALGWHPNPTAATTFIPLTSGHIDQLTRCRDDLARTSLDRLGCRDEAEVSSVTEVVDAEACSNRAVAQSLDELILAYHRAGGWV
jgi:hypothetical protein